MGARALRRGAMLLSAAIAVTACSGSASPTPAPATAAPATAAPATAAPATAAPATTAPTASGPVTLPTPEKTSIKMGLSGNYAVGVMTAVMANYWKLGKKYGIDVEYSTFSSGSQVIQANLAGQIDASDNSAGPVISSLATDSPMAITFVSRYNLTDILVTAANIKTAADLKGKSVAISSFGSVSHADALLALKALGLTAADVTITQVGNDAARLAALQAGSVAASLSDGTKAEKLKAAGFNVLVNLAEVNGLGGVPRTSLTFRQDFIAANPNTVLALTAMDYEALTLWRANPAQAIEALAALEAVDVPTATSEFDALMKEKWEPLNGRCDATIMEFAKEQQLVTNPELASVDAQKACTNEFLDKLDSLGWKPSSTMP